MKTYLTLIFIVLLLTACDPAVQEKKDESNTAKAAQFKTENFYASFEDCDKSEDGCTYFEVSYPVFQDAEFSAVNQFIEGIKSPVFDPDLKSLPLQSIASDFITNYSEFMRDFPESSQSWFMDHSIKVESETDSVLLISAAINEYGGGAHGNYAINYYQVNKATGKPVKLTELYTPEEINRMSTIMSVSIDPSISLLTETIRPNENFILTKDSITFIYNPYEIAPYSEGVIRLTLPRDQSPIM